MRPAPVDVFLFDTFRLDPRGGCLCRQEDGATVPVSLGSRAIELLTVLLNRAGEVVPRHEIMDAVWPGVIVEESNLTVQLSALRRVLDAGRASGSCIQTIPGRGYRFVVPVRREPATDLPAATGSEGGRVGPRPGVAAAMRARVAGPLPRGRFRHRWAAGVFAAMAVIAGLLALGAAFTRPRKAREESPPLSVAVLPFANLSGDPAQDAVAEAATDDLTSDLSYSPVLTVIDRNAAVSYKNRGADMRLIGAQLRVHYVVEGSVREQGNELHVIGTLIDAATGMELWSDRFDQPLDEPFSVPEQAAARLRFGIITSMVETESQRSLREHSRNPGASDCIVRATALEHLQLGSSAQQQILDLYEHALALDPHSVVALVKVAYYLVDSLADGVWGTADATDRADRLLAEARALQPRAPLVLEGTLHWLRFNGRCREVIEDAEDAIHTDPNRIRPFASIGNDLASCRTVMGHAEEEIAEQQALDRLNPLSLAHFNRCRHIGWASLMLGRDADAIDNLLRALPLKREHDVYTYFDYRMLAAAYARTGQMARARQALAELNRLWPYSTVRGIFPQERTSSVYVEQVRAYQAALRLAGLRDHADEDEDEGATGTAVLHDEIAGYTPPNIPGARTVRTADLPALLAAETPVVIDTVQNSWGRSIPGAIGLRHSGLGGSFDDDAQKRLRGKMAELTAGNLKRPVVAVGWNAERFGGLNLALRLVKLGYRNVFWHRGGREAWEVAGYPETELNVQAW